MDITPQLYYSVPRLPLEADKTQRYFLQLEVYGGWPEGRTGPGLP